jgi:hypothetical protein
LNALTTVSALALPWAFKGAYPCNSHSCQISFLKLPNFSKNFDETAKLQKCIVIPREKHAAILRGSINSIECAIGINHYRRVYVYDKFIKLKNYTVIFLTINNYSWNLA